MWKWAFQENPLQILKNQQDYNVGHKIIIEINPLKEEANGMNYLGKNFPWKYTKILMNFGISSMNDLVK